MNTLEIFEKLSMTAVTAADFDQKVLASESLNGVFFWGNNCPNCEQAKISLTTYEKEFRSLGLTWFQVNVYEESDLGTRFGLFGIPVFMFFKAGKKLGRITPFPGFDEFYQAISKLI